MLQSRQALELLRAGGQQQQTALHGRCTAFAVQDLLPLMQQLQRLLAQSPAAAAAALEDISHQHAQCSGAARALSRTGGLLRSDQADLMAKTRQQPCGAVAAKARTNDTNPCCAAQFKAALGITSA